MSRIEMVLQEIDLLNDNELRLVLEEITKRLQQSQKAKNALQKIKGVGAGVWKTDAQDFINQLRANDRS